MATTTNKSRPLITVVFSKDRPLQLDSAIRSMFLRCADPELMQVHVLYTTSSAYQEGLYRQLQLEHPGVAFRRQQHFRRDVLDLIARAPYVAFVVDDTMFTSSFSVRTAIRELESSDLAIGFSLRLGANTTYCYTVDAPQDPPAFTTRGPGVLAFPWPGASLDFGYPFDLSSSIYRSRDLETPLGRMRFDNPNEMEAQLAATAPTAGRRRPELLCLERSAAFSIPANLVQTVARNRSGTRPDKSPERLAAAFERGARIDVASYADFPNVACHQDVALQIREKDPPDPSVSVIIPCYQQAEFLGEAVASVVAQTMTDWEIVIVDDGSADDTAQTARRLIEAYPDRRNPLSRAAQSGRVGGSEQRHRPLHGAIHPAPRRGRHAQASASGANRGPARQGSVDFDRLHRLRADGRRSADRSHRRVGPAPPVRGQSAGLLLPAPTRTLGCSRRIQHQTSRLRGLRLLARLPGNRGRGTPDSRNRCSSTEPDLARAPSGPLRAAADCAAIWRGITRRCSRDAADLPASCNGGGADYAHAPVHWSAVRPRPDSDHRLCALSTEAGQRRRPNSFSVVEFQAR